MDRKKYDAEELNKQATLISAAPTTQTTTTKATNISTTPIDDDDDASIESCDTFETWTLINDKEKSKFRCNLENDNGNRIEILKNNDHDETDHNDEENETEEEPKLQDSLTDVSHEDLSDGISIISETESVDRISPHPYVIDHIHDLNMKFSLSELLDDTILHGMREAMENDMVPALVQHQNQEPSADQQLRHRRISSTAATNTDKDDALQEASQTVAITSGFVPLVKRGLQGIFYMGVGLALLGLIGKIINPTWQPLATDANSPSAAELEQKVNGMELQNNLMRAEIDLLNKQVKYLSSLSDRQQPNPGKYNKDYKQSKTFKAWPGNGDTLKPVDITKQDLRKPYKCPDGSFVEIANMCIEKRPANEPSIIDQLGQVMEDLKEKSEPFKTFEGVAKEFQGFQENPFESKGSKEQLNIETPTKQFIKNKSVYDTLKGNKENLPYPERYQKLWPKEDYDDVYKANTGYKTSFDKDEYRHKPLTREYKKRPDYENLRDNSEERNQWKTDKFGGNSKEKKFRKDNSKEHYTKDFNDSKENFFKENQSKEQRFNKQKRKADDDSGEWHERYMKDREQQRKQNEEKYQDNKNWYIKRGNSRENKRNGEKPYR